MHIILAGIGYVTTKELMMMGARVIMACRSPTKAEDVSVYSLLGYANASYLSVLAKQRQISRK